MYSSLASSGWQIVGWKTDGVVRSVEIKLVAERICDGEIVKRRQAMNYFIFIAVVLNWLFLRCRCDDERYD
jgi:hypothetical protein